MADDDPWAEDAWDAAEEEEGELKHVYTNTLTLNFVLNL